MPTLIELRNQQNEIINEVINNEGIFSDETNANLETTQREIAQKVDAYAYVLKKELKLEEEYWKTKKDEATQMLKRISSNKERMQQLLHAVSSDIELKGIEYTITPIMSETKTIDLDKVVEPYGQYILTLTGVEWETLDPEVKRQIQGSDNVKRKVLLKDLPDNHPAIVKTLRPTISIIKTKK